MSTARAARLTQVHPDRVSALEHKQDSTDKRLASIEDMIKPMYDAFQKALGIRWLVIALGSIAGVTATTVTATVAAIRYFTGH